MSFSSFKNVSDTTDDGSSTSSCDSLYAEFISPSKVQQQVQPNKNETTVAVSVDGDVGTMSTPDDSGPIYNTINDNYQTVSADCHLVNSLEISGGPSTFVSDADTKLDKAEAHGNSQSQLILDPFCDSMTEEEINFIEESQRILSNIIDKITNSDINTDFTKEEINVIEESQRMLSNIIDKRKKSDSDTDYSEQDEPKEIAPDKSFNLTRSKELSLVNDDERSVEMISKSSRAKKRKTKKQPYDESVWIKPTVRDCVSDPLKIQKREQYIRNYYSTPPPYDEKRLSEKRKRYFFNREQAITRFRKLTEEAQNRVVAVALSVEGLHPTVGLSNTPTGFWDTTMPSTQEFNEWNAKQLEECKKYENN